MRSELRKPGNQLSGAAEVGDLGRPKGFAALATSLANPSSDSDATSPPCAERRAVRGARPASSVSPATCLAVVGCGDAGAANWRGCRMANLRATGDGQGAPFANASQYRLAAEMSVGRFQPPGYY